LGDDMNVVLLAQVLGHGSLLMMQRVYAHLAPDDASQAMARLLSSWEN